MSYYTFMGNSSIRSNLRWFFIFVVCLKCAYTRAYVEQKLEGAVIGSSESIDYVTMSKSTSVNTCADAFDGNLNTFFASWETSYTWVGLDFGKPYVISKVGIALHRNSDDQPLIPLGIFEGANRSDFMDALPLFVVTDPKDDTGIVYYTILNSKGFRYVRYVGPAESRCHVSELEFYGYPGSGDDTHLYQITNLPTVSVHTADAVDPFDKEHQIDCCISILSANSSSVLSQMGTIRLRGNASANYPKRPYRIKFNEKQLVLDAPAKAKKWTLINNYGDKTLMRNLLAFEISKKMGMPYTPYGALVDVMVNGEYKGVYQLCDQVQVHKGRVGITEMKPDDNEEEALTGGYLFEIDAYARFEKSWFTSVDGKPVTIHSPDDDAITASQREYIESYFNVMERDWKQYLDLNTFIRHFLVGELSGNTDTYYSVYMYKERGNGTTYVGPVWDFDLAFENDERTYPINEKTDFIFRNGGSCAKNMKEFVSTIIDDETVRPMIESVWREARSKGLSDKQILDVVDSIKNELGKGQKLNFIRWPIMNVKIQKAPVIWGSYDDEVNNVKRYIKERFTWMDSILHYNNTPDYIGEVNKYDSQPIQIFSVSGVYCGSDMISIKPGIYILKQGKNRKKVIKK